VFSGFRDAELAEELLAAGALAVKDGMSKAVTMVIIKDASVGDTGKVVAARAAGLVVILRDEAQAALHPAHGGADEDEDEDMEDDEEDEDEEEQEGEEEEEEAMDEDDDVPMAAAPPRAKGARGGGAGGAAKGGAGGKHRVSHGVVVPGHTFAMTGFRDAKLTARLIAAGAADVKDSMSSKVTVLVVKDVEALAGGGAKVAKAAERGLPIHLREDVDAALTGMGF
jgi:hypothetical protein